MIFGQHLHRPAEPRAVRMALGALLVAAHGAFLFTYWSHHIAVPKPAAAHVRFLALLTQRPAAVPSPSPARLAERKAAATPTASRFVAAPVAPVRADNENPKPTPEQVLEPIVGAAQPISADPYDLSAPSGNAGSALQIDKLRREAGKIDRELRGAPPAISDRRPDSLQARMERGFAAAGKQSTGGFVVHSYTSPDGITTYRRTGGNGVSCYIVPPPSGISAIESGRNERRRINCPPADSGWVKR